MTSVRRCLLVIACLSVWPAEAHAHSTRSPPTLTEAAEVRLQNLSFFLFGFLLSALLIQLLWNALRRDSPALPRLSYLKAVGLLGLWGVVFTLALVATGGARELMTPGEPGPSGIRYRLTPEPQPVEKAEDIRRRQLEWLKDALWRYAGANNGRFPPSRTDPAIPPDQWQLPDATGMQYVYVGGLVATRDGVPLAFEPDVYGGGRWVLFSHGELQLMTSVELTRALPAEKKR
jgi:hypothetical protein